MAFLAKFQQAPPPTSTVPVKGQVTSLPLDLDKGHIRGNEVECAIQSHDHRALPDTERKVIRKMDFRIVPLVTALYVLAFLDRSNIGKYVFPEPIFPLLDRMLSLDLFSSNFHNQSTVHSLRKATLTVES